MNRRTLPWLALRTLTGVCALCLTLNGFWGAYGIEFRTDTILSVLYCGLPSLSFFVFLAVKRPRVAAAFQAILAIGYFVSFTALNWRTCTSFGYCTTIAATILTTLRAGSVLTALAVVLLSALGCAIEKNGSRTPGSHPAL